MDKIPLTKVEFLDPGLFPNTMWRCCPSSKEDEPPQKEVILLEPKPLEKAQLQMTQHFGGGFTS